MGPTVEEGARGKPILVAALVCCAAIVGVILQSRSDGAPADVRPRPDAPCTVAIAHVGAPHDPAVSGGSCADALHWRIRVGGREMTDFSDLHAALLVASRATDGATDPPISSRPVLLRGPVEAPWGLLVEILRECARVGLYKIDWLPSEAGKESTRVPAWLPKRSPPSELHPVILEEIRVLMMWHPAYGGLVRKVGNRGMVESDEELMGIVMQMVRDYGMAGRTDFPLVVDAADDVPWRDVLHLLELCRKEKLQRFEFTAPLPVRRGTLSLPTPR